MHYEFIDIKIAKVEKKRKWKTINKTLMCLEVGDDGANLCREGSYIGREWDEGILFIIRSQISPGYRNQTLRGSHQIKL